MTAQISAPHHPRLPQNHHQQLAVCSTEAKSVSSATAFGGEMRANDLGKLTGVFGGQVGRVLRGRCVLG